MKKIQQLQIYISHAKAMKQRYQKANLHGQHQNKIAHIEEDIRRAQKELSRLRVV